MPPFLRNHWLFRPNRNWQGPKALVPVDICYAVLDLLAWVTFLAAVTSVGALYLEHTTAALSHLTFWALCALPLITACAAVCRGLPFTARFALIALALLTDLIFGALEGGVLPNTSLYAIVSLMALSLFYGPKAGMTGLGVVAAVLIAAAWGWTRGHLPMSLSLAEARGMLIDFRSPYVWIRVLPIMALFSVALLAVLRRVLQRLKETLDQSNASLSLLAAEKAKVQQSRAELLVQEQKFRTLFETANDAVFLLHGRICSSCNRQAEVLFGSKREDLVGHSPLRFSPAQQPDGRDSAESGRGKLAAASEGRPQFFEWQFHRPDGTPFDAEVSLSCVELEEGKFFQAVVRDITERKRTAEELTRERRFFEALFEGLPGNAFVIDENGRYLRWNHNFEQFFGVTADAIKNGTFSFLDWVRPQDRDKVAQTFKQGLATGQGVVEYVAIRADGGEVPRLATGKAFELDGKRYGVGVSLNISERVQAEKALRNSLAQFRALFENANDAILLMNDRGEFLDCNPKSEAVFGSSKAEIIGQSPVRFSPPRQPDGRTSTEVAREKIEAAFAGRPQFFAWQHLRLDGTTFEAEVSLNRVILDERMLLQALVRDVTERKQAEAALRRTSQMLLHAERISKTGGWAFNVKTGALWLSEETRRIYGFDPQAEITLLQIRSFTLPSYRPILDQAFKDLIEQGKPYDVELEFIRPSDGAVIATRSLAEYDSAEGVVLGVFQNITERKLAEKALRESEAKYRSIFDNALEGIFQSSAEGRFVSVNRAMANMLGYDSPEEMITKITDLGTQVYKDPKERERVLQRITQNGQVENLEIQFRRNDGREIWVLMNVHPVADATGRLRCLEGSCLDITHRKQSEELQLAKAKAESANRAKSVFLAKMSHEIRTPIHAVLGFAQLMNRDSTLNEAQRERLRVISRNGEHLMTLINDILDVAKIEAQQVTLQLRPFDLMALGPDLHEMFAADAAEKGLQLKFEVAPDLPRWVTSDEGKLRQILINLLGNALKFTLRGHIIVRLRTESLPQVGWRLLAEVEDTGPGIDPGESGRLFQPFEQTEQGRKSGAGTGLGLAISREFARKLGGDLTFESEVGRGSVFRVEVMLEPASAGDSADERASPRPTLPAAASAAAAGGIEPLASLPPPLPVELVNTLRQAVLEVDADRIAVLIEQVKVINPVLAGTLKAYAAQFDYDRLAALLPDSAEGRAE